MGGLVDRRAILVTTLLLFSGIIMLYSASSPFSLRHYGSDTSMLIRQLMAAGVGILVLILLESWDYHNLVLLNDVLLVGGILLTVLTILPIGISDGRWLPLGPFTFQPTEAVKFSLILFMAHSLSRKGDKIRTFSEGVLPYLILLGLLAAIVIVQPDLGMILVLGAVVLAMLFFAGARILHLLAVCSASVPLVFVAIRLAPYRFARLLSFLNPQAYSQSTGYQTLQSLTAVGSGGILGRGLGASHAKLFYLPQSHNDFIMSVLAEELGFVGVLAVAALIGALVWRAFRIAESAPDRLGKLLAMGIGFALGFQTLVNLGVVIGLLPVTGLTFPFFSNGGSSLIITLALVGVLLNVSKQGGPA
ncbi:putative lipid II flippase FtsW [Candidatus Bipolaricaulota bacterium]|nr:putative lipid II flippase FtsW [Candidatus Bipolaricaulota bacterium]